MSSEKSLATFTVMHKKHRGQLYVTTERIVFITDDKKQVSFKRDGITDCKGSRSNVSKAQVLTSTQNYVFTFCEDPVEKNRNRFRDIILNLVSNAPASLPSSRASSLPATSEPTTKVHMSSAASSLLASGNTEAQTRAALLAREPKLRKIYEELVEKDLLTDEEFWSSRKHLLENEAHSSAWQKVGLSSGLLTDVHPEIGANTVSYTLNVNTISQIFATMPAVLRAYKDNVPDKMTETEFWTKYFRSQYFHRASGQHNASIADPKEDIFSLYERDEDKALYASTSDAIERRKLDIPIHRMVDLSLDEASELDSLARQKHLLQGGAQVTKSSRAIARNELLQKFNRHGQTVLRSAVPSGRSDASLEQYRRELKEGVRLDELEEQQTTPLHELRIENPEVFLGSVTMRSRLEVEPSHEEQIKRSYAELAKELLVLKGESHSIDPIEHFGQTELVAQLTDQCRASERTRRAGAVDKLMLFGSSGNPDEVIPTKFLAAVRDRNTKCAELLRHFWSCFPVQTADDSARLVRCNDALSRQHDEILTLRSKLHSKKFSSFVPLLDPVMRMLEKAFARMQRHTSKQPSKPNAVSANPAAKRQKLSVQ